MTTTEDEHDSKKSGTSRATISHILEEQKLEIELAKRVDEVSMGLEHIPTLPHHTELGTGFHVMGMIFTIVGLFRALNNFLKGERLNASDTAQLVYAMTLLVLVVIGILLPEVALVIGVVAASISFAMSVFRLVQYGLKRWPIYVEQTKLRRELAELRRAWCEDEETLSRVTREDEKSNLLKRVEARTNAIAKWHEKYDRSLFALKTLSGTHAAFRAFSILSTSLGLIGAIFLFVPALAMTGGILLVVVASLVGVVSLGAGLRYIKRRWFSPTVAAEEIQKSTPIVSPEVSEAPAETVEKTPQKTPPAPPSIKPSPLRPKEEDDEEDESESDSDSDRPHQ